jgi:hypothetical protein
MFYVRLFQRRKAFPTVRRVSPYATLFIAFSDFKEFLLTSKPLLQVFWQETKDLDFSFFREASLSEKKASLFDSKGAKI